MARNSDAFFSAQVMMQIQAAAGHSIVFGDFPEMAAPRSPFPSVSASKIESSQGSRSDLTLPGSITRRVNELSINDLTQSHARTTCHPLISADKVISGIDHDRPCQLLHRGVHRDRGAALRHPGNSARRIPLGLRNNSTVYSDQIRVSMEHLRFSDLVRLDIDQVRSKVVPGQKASSTPDPLNNRQISVVSVEGESSEEHDLQHKRNASTATEICRPTSTATEICTPSSTTAIGNVKKPNASAGGGTRMGTAPYQPRQQGSTWPRRPAATTSASPTSTRHPQQ
jgi:hypothetical protein